MKKIFEVEWYKILVFDEPISKQEIIDTVGFLRWTLIKAVIDIWKKMIAVWWELHVDEEQLLLELWSNQSDLWWINLYLQKSKDEWIEFDSMINVRVRDWNRTRGVDDPKKRELIKQVVYDLILD
jgi:hypothetical protein